jgi:hypothetical protein
MMTQALEIAKRPHIIVATPGRLRDHIESSDIDLSRLQFLVSTLSFLPSRYSMRLIGFCLIHLEQILNLFWIAFLRQGKLLCLLLQ